MNNFRCEMFFLQFQEKHSGKKEIKRNMEIFFDLLFYIKKVDKRYRFCSWIWLKGTIIKIMTEPV